VSECCGEELLSRTDGKHRRILWIMLGINGGMFLIEMISGILAHSTSLIADSADMFADAFIYGVSIFVVGESTLKKARVSLVKGILMGLLGFGALYEACTKLLVGTMPDVVVMSGVGGLALLANIVCAFLILKHKDDDINMKSTWICSRNDVIANLGILVAAGLVYLINSNLPDAIIGAIIAALILKSSFGIVLESRRFLNNV